MFTIYSSNGIENPTNCLYPNKIEVFCADDLKKALSHDYVCASYRSNYRSNDNFIVSNCLAVDCDNDHSDDPTTWVSVEDVRNAFPSVSFAVHYSRSHMKSKKGKAPRPKFHILFPINEITNKDDYKSLKQQVLSNFKYFDDNAVDAARFFYGTVMPEVKIVEGSTTIDEYLDDMNFEKAFKLTIEEGKRNSTMSLYAGKVIKKYGNTTEGYEAFLKLAESCTPPLSDDELSSIWNSAKKFYSSKVLKDKGYIPPEEFKKQNEWKQKLAYNDKHQLINCSSNLILILQNDPAFKNIAYNDFIDQVEILGDVPWERAIGNKYWRDSDTSQVKSIIDKHYLAFSTRNHDVSFDKVVHDRHFHPVRDFLNGLPAWDGVERVDDLFIKYFQAEDTPYIRAVTRKVFTACVARIFEPGVKFDSIPVLDGEQGIGKSSIIKYLAGSTFFSDALTLTDMNDKAGAEKLQGYWIIEIGELAGMKKADIEKVKSFISCTDDKYRASYGKVVENHPRQCVIFATVNGERGYLRDITGNRRFWIIKLNQKEPKWTWKEEPYFREQFWAECIVRYNKGEKLFLEGDLLEEANEQQRKAMEVDERLGLVQEYLETPLPSNWESMDLFARRSFFDGDDITNPKGTVKRTSVCNAEVWAECFRKNISDIKPADSYAITGLIMQLGGWEKQKTPRKTKIYGSQRMYIRK